MFSLYLTRANAMCAALKLIETLTSELEGFARFATPFRPDRPAPEPRRAHSDEEQKLCPLGP